MPATALFQAQQLFKNLDADDVDAVAALSRTRHWPAGTTLFQRGDPGRDMILITSGRIRLSVLSVEGRELSLRHAEAGTLIGEIAVLDGGPRSADATAVTDVTGEVVSKADLDRLIARRPQIAAAFIAVLCDRLRETTEQLESIALYKLEARLARFILGLVRQKLGDSDPVGKVQLNFPFNQSEVADVIGASRPKVNRAFAELEAMGAISRNGDNLVCKLDRLSDIAEGDGA